MMSFDRDRHHRSSLRWRGYDYTQAGTYFVTICTRERALFFADEVVREIAERCWAEIPKHFPVGLDAWVVMPNHLHGLIVIGAREEQSRQEPGVQLNAPTKGDEVGGDTAGSQPLTTSVFPGVSPRSNTLGVILRTYKAAVTTACRREGFLGFGWQRGYYDRVVRDDRELANIRHYIAENPQRWQQDEHHPERLHRLPPGIAPPSP